MDTERVREAHAKLRTGHFPELEIDVFFERSETDPSDGDSNASDHDDKLAEQTLG